MTPSKPTDGHRRRTVASSWLRQEGERKASLQIRRFLVGERRERAFARRSQTGIEAEGFIIQRVSASCILPLCWIRGSWRVWSNHPWAVPPPPPLPPLPNAPPRFLFSTILLLLATIPTRSCLSIVYPPLIRGERLTFFQKRGSTRCIYVYFRFFPTKEFRIVGVEERLGNDESRKSIIKKKKIFRMLWKITIIWYLLKG